MHTLATSVSKNNFLRKVKLTSNLEEERKNNFSKTYIKFGGGKTRVGGQYQLDSISCFSFARPLKVFPLHCKFLKVFPFHWKCAQATFHWKCFKSLKPCLLAVSSPLRVLKWIVSTVNPSWTSKQNMIEYTHKFKGPTNTYSCNSTGCFFFTGPPQKS